MRSQYTLHVLFTLLILLEDILHEFSEH